MPHGLDVDRALTLLAEQRPIWVARLKDREGVSVKPMKLIGISGINGVLMDIQGKHRFRVPLAKLETTASPRPYEPKLKLVPLVKRIVESISEVAPPSEPEPIRLQLPAQPNPREQAMVNAKALRVVYRPDTKCFYTKKQTWSLFLDQARRYPPNQVNRAIGKMRGKDGRFKSVAMDAITVEQAEALGRTHRGEPEPAPVIAAPEPQPAPIPAAEPAPVIQAAPAVTPAAAPARLPPPPSQDLRDVFERVARAMRNKASADAMALNAQAELLIADADLAVAIMRNELGL